jgi:hypothetical protein
MNKELKTLNDLDKYGEGENTWGCKDGLVEISELNRIYNIDCLEGLKKLEDESIDLIITSPPFNLGNNHHTGTKRHKSYEDNLKEEEYQKIVKKTNAKYILLSYNNEGLMTIKDVQEILSLRGEPKTFILKYKRFKADKTENRNHKSDCTYEYLHFVKCDENNEEIKNKEFPIIEIDSLTLNNQKRLTD